MFPKIRRYNNLIKTILLFCILLFFSFILLFHFTINLRENMSYNSNNINFTQCCVKDNNGNEFRYSGNILNANDINTLQNNLYLQRFTIDNIRESKTFDTNLDPTISTWGSIDCDNIDLTKSNTNIYRYTISQYNKSPVSGYFYGNVKSSNGNIKSSNTFINGDLKRIYKDIIIRNNYRNIDKLSSISSITSNPDTYSQYKDLANELLKESNKNASQSKIIYNDLSNLKESFVEGNYTINDMKDATIDNDNTSQTLIDKANNPCLIPNQDHMNFSSVGGLVRYWDDTRSNYRDNRGWGIRYNNGYWNRYFWPRKYYDSASHPNCPTSKYGW
uniref:Uncharacterized protein n=1 Tax=viral metagenome TaxID=1070528 RepID=A0A6C0HSU1_9ZZZZ